VIFQPVMGWYFALMILYVSAEIGVASWIVIYLQRVHGLDVLPAQCSSRFTLPD
jgi:fucose permease